MLLEWNRRLANSGKVEAKEEYLKAKKDEKAAVYFAKTDAQAEQFASINSNSDRIFKMAKRLKWDNADIVEEICVWNNEGKLTLTVDDKLKSWQSHYQKLLNVGFQWNASHLSHEPPKKGPAIKITTEVSKAINKIKAGKAAGLLSNIIVITKAVNKGITDCIT